MRPNYLFRQVKLQQLNQVRPIPHERCSYAFARTTRAQNDLSTCECCLQILDDIGNMRLSLNDFWQVIVIIKRHPLNGVRCVKVSFGT